MDRGHEESKPVLYWDADCRFCRRWVERWQSATAGRVAYRTLQDSPPDVVRAAGGEPFQRIVLAEPDGTLLTGAHAAFGALGGMALALYRACPPFRAVADGSYTWIAAHRAFCAKMTNLLWGPQTLVQSYEISGLVFPRLVGLIFLFAFLSLWTQIDGLVGSRGILPVAGHLAAVQEHCEAAGQGWEAWLKVPSLFWLGCGDRMLHVWLGLGTAAALLLCLGFYPALSAFAAWLCYLSFAAAVPVFLDFQWDALLLETGLLVVFYVPWTRFLRFGSSAPSRIGRLLLWWLLFRLMFESGVVKLHGFDASGRNAWLDGTALDYHYFTQPIPVWTSWWIAQLPAWFHRLSLAGVFAVELVLPFFIPGPRRLRMLAFWGFSLLMGLIAVSGHYGFFNLLTLVLCLSLVDDACWPAPWRNRLARQATDRVAGSRERATRMRNTLLPWFAAAVFFLTGWQLLLVLRITPPRWVSAAAEPFLPLRSANSYGLFSVMTTERPEIFIEASPDGRNWHLYRFRYAMAPTDSSLPFFLPHMPRLDWQLWFAALEYRSSGRLPAWILALLARLQERSPGVIGLLEPSEATEFRAEFFRVRLDLLTFADPATHAKTGHYWQAEELPGYTVEGSLQQQPPADPK